MAWQAVLWEAPARRAGVIARAACLLCLPLLLCLPWPDATVVQGVVWAPDEALVRPEADGFVDTVHMRDGDQVHAGDLLVSLRNPHLVAERERIASQLAQAEQNTFAHLGTDSSKAGQAGDQVLRWQGQLARIDEQLAALQVRAHRAGRLVMPHAEDLPGRYLHRGELLGHVLGDEAPTVRVALAESDVSAWSASATDHSTPPSLSVRLGAPGSPVWAARLQRDSVGATRQLPSAALSQDMGGQVPTDPQDEHHMKAMRPVVLMDVQAELDDTDTASSTHGRLGERAWVRIDNGWSPLPWQAWRWVRRRALADFNPAR